MGEREGERLSECQRERVNGRERDARIYMYRRMNIARYDSLHICISIEAKETYYRGKRDLL
jgi:hypothetical protein